MQVLATFKVKLCLPRNSHHECSTVFTERSSCCCMRFSSGRILLPQSCLQDILIHCFIMTTYLLSMKVSDKEAWSLLVFSNGNHSFVEEKKGMSEDGVTAWEQTQGAPAFPLPGAVAWGGEQGCALCWILFTSSSPRMLGFMSQQSWVSHQTVFLPLVFFFFSPIWTSLASLFHDIQGKRSSL